MTSWPDLESLQLLVLVGQRGSLTAAAAETGVSQPAVSKRLSALERRLGLHLVDRTRQGSVLTPAGTLVSGWAQRVLDDMAVLCDGAQTLRQDRRAHLTIAASLTVAEYLLPAWLGELRRASPDLQVGLQVMNSRRVFEQVRDGAVDVGFVETPAIPRNLRSRTVARDRLVLVVPQGHAWVRRRSPVDPAELAATALVTREAGSGTRETADRALAAAGTRTVRPLLELGSNVSVRSAVLAGVGPALISKLVVAADIASGVLVEVETTGVDLTRALRAVWRSGARPDVPAADLLAQAVRRRS
jgi:DNA-binding transcriptional LysR family regulator